MGIDEETTLTMTAEESLISRKKNRRLWDRLLEHFGHHIVVAKYGNPDDPDNVCLECEDCNTVVVDAELYTICPRGDVWFYGEELDEE